MEFKTLDTLGKEIPYDLRQIYAVDLVGEHLKDIARARKSDNYSLYLKCIKDLYIIIQHKIKKPKDEDKKDKKDQSKSYITLLDVAVKAANKYPQVFLGADKDPEGCAAIEQSLNDLEMFLYKKIEEANMFGSSKRVPGL